MGGSEAVVQPAYAPFWLIEISLNRCQKSSNWHLYAPQLSFKELGGKDR